MLALLVDATALPAYDLGPEHPFARDRQLPLFDLMRRSGLYTDAELLHPHPASSEELQTVHRADYVELLMALDHGHDREIVAHAPRYGMGTADNPIEPGQHAGAAAVAGATLDCVRAVIEGRADAAFNPAGGLHPAMPAAASGFCISNDCAIGIVEARRRGVERV